MSLYERNFHVPDRDSNNGPNEDEEDDEYDETLDLSDEEDLKAFNEPIPAETEEEDYDKALDAYEKNLEGGY